jgi:hypothetical protein
MSVLLGISGDSASRLRAIRSGGNIAFGVETALMPGWNDLSQKAVVTW